MPSSATSTYPTRPGCRSPIPSPGELTRTSCTIVGLIAFATWIVAAAANAGELASPEQIFEKRIAPILQSDDPSSCTECHLAGVDLKNYILPDARQTFVALRDSGMIDLDQPANSKILGFISRRAEPESGAALIDEKVRAAEYEAFAAWIKACATNNDWRNLPAASTGHPAAENPPSAVIRHGRVDRVTAAFESSIWSQRFRCLGCHMPGGPENARLVDEFGEQVSWIRPEGAAATMRHLIDNGHVDLDRPEQSLLLLKPLNEVEHGGGQKMLKGDLGYKAFRTWLEDYAATIRGKYKSDEDLPPEPDAPGAFPSEIWLKLTDTPPAWADRLLQVTVYAWDNDRGSWEIEPIAVSDRGVFGKGRLWQHSLLLLARKDTPRHADWFANGAVLSLGRYRVAVHVDLADRLRDDWSAAWQDGDFAGYAEVNTDWPRGYDSMTVIDAATVRLP